MKKSVVAGLMACMILVSGGVGFGAGMLGGQYSAQRSSSQGTEAEPVSTMATEVKAENSNALEADTSTVLSTSQIVQKVSDSVVEIRTEVEKSISPLQKIKGEAAGSGVIVSEDGYILTNNHVIEDAQEIHIRLKDGTLYDATLVGTDPSTDIAVIKVEATDLPYTEMGDSTSLLVGDDVVAIGNPLGELGGTVTNGIVSALDREVEIGGELMNLIQTNAAINPGNSGGGLFNAKGELIGIVVAKSSGNEVEGLGFAVPINTAKEVAEDLIRFGYVTNRAEFGISVIDVTDARSAFMYRVPGTGVYIAEVKQDSAAQKAGLQVGDGIIKIGDEKVSTSKEVHNQMKKYKAGDSVTLTILRDSEEISVEVILQESVPDQNA